MDVPEQLFAIWQEQKRASQRALTRQRIAEAKRRVERAIATVEIVRRIERRYAPEP